MSSADEESAAELMMLLEPGIFRDELEQSIPDEPAAWRAWARRLRTEASNYAAWRADARGAAAMKEDAEEMEKGKKQQFLHGNGES